MDMFDDAKLAEPFGLVNSGVICYMNSLLQALISCTSFNKAVIANEEYMHKTKLGSTLFNFVSSFLDASADSGLFSIEIVKSLMAELAERRPNIKYGTGQECASEGLTLILDMLSDPDIGIDDVDNLNPIAKLFSAKYDIVIHCTECKHKATSTQCSSQYFIHSYDDMQNNLIISRTHLPEYVCDGCKQPDACIKVKTLAKVSEIIVITDIMILNGRFIRQMIKVNQTPAMFQLPGSNGAISFGKVAQVEQSGSLSSGHYISKGVRKGRTAYLFNDRQVSKIADLTPTSNTFMTFYHIFIPPTRKPIAEPESAHPKPLETVDE
jgi:ubiquitin C-terminal hydrolase